jgi:ribosomal protein S27E
MVMCGDLSELLMVNKTNIQCEICGSDMDHGTGRDTTGRRHHVVYCPDCGNVEIGDS